MDLNLPVDQQLDPYAFGQASGLSLYPAFLGPPPRPMRTNPFEKRNVEKYNMDEAYIGKNEVLPDTLMDWMLTASATWYTDVALPWRATDNIHIAWMQREANAHYLGVTPYQAGSRSVTQRSTVRQATLRRRGITMEWEDDFVATPLGRTTFLVSMMQIVNSVQETANVGVLQALINCHRYQHQFHRDHGVIRNEDLMGYLERDRDRFAAAQKSFNGLEILDVEVDKEVREVRGTANMWIVPEEVSNYTLAIPQKTIYSMGGQEAVDRLNGKQIGPVASANTQGAVDSVTPLHMVRQTPVYIARSFLLEGIGKQDLLLRVRQIGEYNTMTDECADHSRYTTKSRSIMIYNEDIDDFSCIELEDAIEHCGLWGEGGRLRHPGRPSGAKGRFDDDDIDRDFLTYRSNAPEVEGEPRSGLVATQFVGDISPEYFTTEDLLNAARTVLNAYTHGDSARMSVVETALAGATVTATEMVGGGGRGLAVTINDAGAGDILQGIVKIVGQDGLFTPPADLLPGDNIVPPVESAIASLLAPGAVRIVRDAGAPPPREAPDAARFGEALIKSLVGVVPEEDRTEAMIAVQDAIGGDVAERVEQLRPLLRAAAEEGLIPTRKNGPAIDQYIRERVESYEERVARLPEEPARAPVGGAAEVRYAYPGRSDLPAGWRYEDPAHADPKLLEPARKKTVPTEPHEIPYIAAQMRAAKAGAQAPQGPGGVRQARGAMGLAGIGRFDYGEGPQYPRLQQMRARRQGAGGAVDTRQNVSVHLGRLDAAAASPATKVAAALYLGAAMTKQTMLQFARNNVVVPMNFLLFRPHATYQTRYMIKCASGGASGYTWVGHANMQIGNDPLRKVGMGHFTLHMASIVSEARNVNVVPDVYVQRYMGGLGVGFFDPATYKATAGRGLMPAGGKSIICAAIPYRERERDIPKVLDVSGRFHTEYRQGLVREDVYTELLYSTAYRYNRDYGFYDPVRGGRKLDQPNNRYGGVGVNRICWRGHQFNYNVVSGAYDIVRTNKGHWGDKVYAGCGQVRNGKKMYLGEQFDHSRSLMHN